MYGIDLEFKCNNIIIEWMELKCALRREMDT